MICPTVPPQIPFVVAVAAVVLALVSPSARAEERTVNFYIGRTTWRRGCSKTSPGKPASRSSTTTFDARDLETRFLAGKSGYDVVVPTAYFLQRQITANVFPEAR